jgi:hypothetical protein
LQLIHERGRLQHELPLSAWRRLRAGFFSCKEQPVVIVVLDETCAPGLCEGCGGTFKPWGYARPRLIRERAGVRLLLRPRRVRCERCRVTHVLLPATFVPRRADSAPVIVTALLANAAGHGHRSVAADLSLPAATVRSWLRRARANAEHVRAAAIHLIHETDPLDGPIEPAGSILGDLLEVLGRATAAVRRRLGPIGPPMAIAMIIGQPLLRPRRS